MINPDHLEAFLQCMRTGDIQGALHHVADTIVLRSPIVPTPFEGKDAFGRVITQLMDTLDVFQPRLLMCDGADAVAVLTIRLEDHVIDAFDHIRLSEDGLVESMTVAWRPLPAVVAVQQKLVPKLGGEALKLVPLEATELPQRPSE